LIELLQTRRFEKAVAKLHAQQKKVLDKAIRDILAAPEEGEMKKGDLAGVRIAKFRMENQLVLLAYTYEEATLTLLALGSHENFYRDLKK
jgi:mRNA-degrading endonuclease YafQ of YafQ-DinJ toxin-antitoxin module